METALTVLIWIIVGAAGLWALAWLVGLLFMIFVLKQGGKG